MNILTVKIENFSKYEVRILVMANTWSVYNIETDEGVRCIENNHAAFKMVDDEGEEHIVGYWKVRDRILPYLQDARMCGKRLQYPPISLDGAIPRKETVSKLRMMRGEYVREPVEMWVVDGGRMRPFGG